MVFKNQVLLQVMILCFLFLSEVFYYISLDSFILNLFGTFVFLGIVIFLKRDYLFFSVLFMLPNHRLYSIPGTDFSLINVLFFFLLIRFIWGVLKTNRQFFAIYSIIFLYSGLTSIINSDFTIVLHSIKILSVFIVLNLLIIKIIENPDYWIKSTILFFIAGVIAASILGLLLDPEYTTDSIGTKQRFSGGEFNNPNIFGFEISYAISLLMVYVFYFRKHITISVIGSLILILFGLLTQSRSFYFIAFLLLLFTIKQLSNLFNFKNILKLFIIGVVILSIAFMWGNEFSKIFQAGLDRIINPRGGDITASRFTLWIIYINFLITHPIYLLFGIGFFKIQTINEFLAHNAIIEVIVAWGIIGFLLFSYLFVQVWNQIKTLLKSTGGNKGSSFRFLPLIVLFLSSMTGHSFLSNPFIIKFTISILIIYYFHPAKHKTRLIHKPIKP